MPPWLGSQIVSWLWNMYLSMCNIRYEIFNDDDARRWFDIGASTYQSWRGLFCGLLTSSCCEKLSGLSAGGPRQLLNTTFIETPFQLVIYGKNVTGKPQTLFSSHSQTSQNFQCTTMTKRTIQPLCTPGYGKQLFNKLISNTCFRATGKVCTRSDRTKVHGERLTFILGQPSSIFLFNSKAGALYQQAKAALRL